MSMFWLRVKETYSYISSNCSINFCLTEMAIIMISCDFKYLEMGHQNISCSSTKDFSYFFA